MTLSELIIQLATIIHEKGDLHVIVDGTEAKHVEVDQDANGTLFVEIG